MSDKSEEQSQNDSQKPTEERTELAEERTEMAEERSELAEERSKLAENRTEWAEDRTEWAQHRTVLANERTFIAWVRTGLSAMAVGVGIVELLREEDLDITIPIVGIILIILGGGISIVSLWRYFHVNKVMEKSEAHVTPTWVAASLTGGLLIVAILLLLQVIRQI
jgi:uncharacterized membrane protein YidH (DUF202 family)